MLNVGQLGAQEFCAAQPHTGDKLHDKQHALSCWLGQLFLTEGDDLTRSHLAECLGLQHALLTVIAYFLVDKKPWVLRNVAAGLEPVKHRYHNGDGLTHTAGAQWPAKRCPSR